MFKFSRLRFWAQVIEQANSPLRWLDLYAADTALKSVKSHLQKGPLSEDEARLLHSETSIDLLILCSYVSCLGQSAVDVNAMQQYRSLGLRIAASEDYRMLLEVWEKVGLLSMPDACSETLPLGALPLKENSALVWHQNRLHLHRVWQQVERCEAWLAQGAERIPPLSQTYQSSLQQGFAKLFPAANSDELDWQALAAAQSLYQGLSLVSGGPGTGKTSTAARIVVLVLMQELLRGLEAEAVRLPKIRLLAPTGKAAVRLYSSIQAQTPKLLALLETLCDWPALFGHCFEDLFQQAFPAQGETIHRALLSVRDGLEDDRLRHLDVYIDPTELLQAKQEAPRLDADIVLIDEASMIDLKLMNDLCRLLPQARVVLLGDHFQLPPVEPGEIFAEWVKRFELRSYSPDQIEAFKSYIDASLLEALALPEAPKPPRDVHPAQGRMLCQLQKTWRFSGPIYEFAQALRSGLAPDIAKLFPIEQSGRRSSSEADLLSEPALTWVNLSRSDTSSQARLNQELMQCIEGYSAYFDALAAGASVQELAKLKSRYQVLSSSYDGVLGVQRLNTLVEQRFANGRALYAGKVIMVTRNQAELDLYNGDIGFLQSHGEAGREHYTVAFPDKADATYEVSLSLIHEWQAAYALTIHKSQGSEYERVAVFVPDYASELMSRRLVYTGITRSQESVELWISAEGLDQLFRET